MDGSGQHGLAGGASDDVSGFADADAWEQGGFFVEVIGHGGETGGDDSSDIGSAGGHHVKGDGGAEIDDDGRGSEVVVGGDRVGESILTDGFGLGIIESNAAQGFG